jgi:type IV secretory pathway VirB2 component (pilin)
LDGAVVTSASDPSALLAAIRWLQDVLLGPVAIAVAIIAVAGMGYLALSGRIDLRRGACVITGCFIVFGASTIARGIQAAAGAPDAGFLVPSVVTPAPQAMPVAVPTATPAQYDPYAGPSILQH